MNTYALYVHIPFCKKKCDYCDFISFANKEKLIPEYLEALKAETEHVSSLYGHPELRTIFIGGGTPTLLDERSISELFKIIRDNFDVSKVIESTIEANPGTVTKEKLELLKKLGVDRISFGAQSFSDKNLKTIGRIHNSKEISEAFHLARSTGFKNINLDLIFALLGETMDEWRTTLNEAIKLKPEHISAYNLQIEEDTPLFNRIKDKKAEAADQETEAEMYEAAISALKNNGYEHYEISNFALPGFECEHNKVYWEMKDYLGLGLAAHSFVSDERIANTEDLSLYLKKDMGSIKTSHKNTKKETISEFVFMGLRLLKGIELPQFRSKFGEDFLEIYGKETAELAKDGLIKINENRVSLTEKGLYLGNEVFKRFI